MSETDLCLSLHHYAPLLLSRFSPVSSQSRRAQSRKKILIATWQDKTGEGQAFHLFHIRILYHVFKKRSLILHHSGYMKALVFKSSATLNMSLRVTTMQEARQ